MAKLQRKQADGDQAIQLLDYPNPAPSPEGRKDKRKDIANTGVQATLRALGLQSFYAWSNAPEQPKAVQQKDRTIAILRCAVHALPLAGSLTLIYLNFSWYLLNANGGTLGYFDPSTGLVGLQFAAKFHELTMVASLTTVFLSFVRPLLLSKDGLPFGAAFSGLQITQLTYLWSPEMWSIIQSKWFKWQKKVTLVFAIVITASLVATVGPASAACMIPRLNLWQSRTGTLVISSTVDDFFPVDLYASLYNQDQNCKTESNTSYPGFRQPCLWSNDMLGLSSLISLGYNLSNGREIWIPSPKRANWSYNEENDFWLASAFADPLPSFTFSTDVSNSTPDGVASVSTSVQAVGLWSLIRETSHPWLDVENVFDATSLVTARSYPVSWNFSHEQPFLEFIPGQPKITAISTSGRSNLLAELEELPASTTSYETFRFVDLGDEYTYGIVLITYYPTLLSKIDQSTILVTPLTFELGWVQSTWRQRLTNIQSSKSLAIEGRDFRHAKVSSSWIDTINPSLSNVNTTWYNYFVNTMHVQPSDVRIPSPSTNINRRILLVSALLTASLSKMTPQRDIYSAVQSFQGPGSKTYITRHVDGRVIIFMGLDI